jgi:hypothetical protein
MRTRVTIVAVGYGAVREARTTGPPGILANDECRRGAGTFRSLPAAWWNTSMNPATGDSQCTSLDDSCRVDTAVAHAFLDPFLTGGVRR